MLFINYHYIVYIITNHIPDYNKVVIKNRRYQVSKYEWDDIHTFHDTLYPKQDSISVVRANNPSLRLSPALR